MKHEYEGEAFIYERWAAKDYGGGTHILNSCKVIWKWNWVDVGGVILINHTTNNLKPPCEPMGLHMG